MYQIESIQPLIMRRECGGWLATSPADAAIRLGVTAGTEAEARKKFTQSLARWIEILESKAAA
jgi:hypothetical protein